VCQRLSRRLQFKNNLIGKADSALALKNAVQFKIRACRTYFHYSAEGRGHTWRPIADYQGVYNMVKYFFATAFAALLLSTTPTLSIADDQAPPPNRHTMGDSGKLPASGAASSRVPSMGAGTGESTGTEGSHKMGDEGKLPATNAGSTRVPEMSNPDNSDK
jgi:hypothetical protein